MNALMTCVTVYIRITLKATTILILLNVTMKNIPETDTISRLSLSGKGWKGSGFPVMGFTLSTWEYFASNWGRSSSWNDRVDSVCCTTYFYLYQKSDIYVL